MRIIYESTPVIVVNGQMQAIAGAVRSVPFLILIRIVEVEKKVRKPNESEPGGGFRRDARVPRRSRDARVFSADGNGVAESRGRCDGGQLELGVRGTKK